MAQTASPPLVLEAKIPLGQVSGRIDHLGIDVKGSDCLSRSWAINSLGVVDMAAGKVLSRMHEGSTRSHGAVGGYRAVGTSLKPD